MLINWSLATLAWSVLAAVVLALAAYRFVLLRGDYTVLHVRRSEMALIPGQVRKARLIDRIDRWGSTLTALAIAVGILLIGLYIYDSAFGL